MKTWSGNQVIETIIRFAVPEMPIPEAQVIGRISRANFPILITGESGTGKELLARAIHLAGSFSNRMFLTIDCASLPSGLIESELFGHVKGAFTGAYRPKQGLLSSASGGTVFLDEIGELPLEMQTKLLRAIQEREVRPVGGKTFVPIDSRIIAASNRDLRFAMQQGTFREDLFYRLRVIELQVVPLRERVKDIPTLVECILRKMSRESSVPSVNDEAMRLMKEFRWPGNVRELENALQLVVALNPDAREIRPENLPSFLRSSVVRTPRFEKSLMPMREVERITIIEAMSAAEGNKMVAAKSLGIGKTTLYRKLSEYKAAGWRCDQIPNGNNSD